jgi:hypothetical protein
MSSRSALGALGVSLSMLAEACASGSTPPAAPAPGSAEAPKASATSQVAGATDEHPASSAGGDVSPATSAVAETASRDESPAGADECRVQAELGLAYERLGQGQPRKQWIADARERLLARDEAERVLTGISQEILSAIAHRKYEKLVAFAGKDGVCMRPARGAPCQTLSASALAGCAQSRVRMEWPRSAADPEPPSYSCGEAFRHIFYARDFLHVGKPHFNCFAGVGDGAQQEPIITSGSRIGYVELRSEEADGTHSLWFVFDGAARAPELVEMMSDHYGSPSGANP